MLFPVIYDKLVSFILPDESCGRSVVLMCFVQRSQFNKNRLRIKKNIMKNKIKVLVWGWHDNDQKKALQQQENITIVHWFNNSTTRKELNRIIHRPFELKIKHTPLDPELQKDYDSNLPKFLEMYSRSTYSLALSYSEQRNLYNIYFHWALHTIKQFTPDIILYASPPHFGPDYLLYILANKLKIKTKLCYQSLFSDRFFCVNKIEELGQLGSKDISHSKNNINLYLWMSQPLFYMSNLKYYNKSPWASLIRNLTLGSKQFAPFTIAGSFCNFSDAKIFKRQLKTVIQNPELNKPYVYFPLQLQPEMTTSCLGGDYSDQLLAIEKISQIIPDDWLIYVKENPNQKPRQRGEWFFKRLKTIKKSRYITPRFSSPILINHSQFVSVITGTAGFEASLSLIPTVTFGHAWFNSMPGVITFNNELSLDDIMKPQWSMNDCQSQINKIVNYSYEGIIDPEYYPSNKNYNSTENTKNLYNFLRKILV